MASSNDYLNSYMRYHEHGVKSICLKCFTPVLPTESCNCVPPKEFDEVQSDFENIHMPNIMKQDKEYEEKKKESPSKGDLDWSKCTLENAEKEFNVSHSLVTFFKDHMNDDWYQANKESWDKHKDVLLDNPWMMFQMTNFRDKYNAVKQGDRGSVLDFIFRRVKDEKVADNCKEFLKTGATR